MTGPQDTLIADEETETTIPPGGDTPATGAEGGESSPPEKDATQLRIDELTREKHEALREKARAEGRAEAAEALAAKAATPVIPEVEEKELDPEDFSSDADYLRAVATQEREKIRAEGEEARKREAADAVTRTNQQLVTDATAKHADFREVVFNPDVKISTDMYDAAKGDNFIDVLYHLGKNPVEAARIFTLPPIQQAKEIGKIEVKITTTPVQKTDTNAGDIPTTLGSGHTPTTKADADKTRDELHADWNKEPAPW